MTTIGEDDGKFGEWRSGRVVLVWFQRHGYQTMMKEHQYSCPSQHHPNSRRYSRNDAGRGQFEACAGLVGRPAPVSLVYQREAGKDKRDSFTERSRPFHRGYL